MNNRIGAAVKHVWNDAMHVLHNFGGLSQIQQQLYLGRCSLHLLLLKSSMPKLSCMGSFYTRAPYLSPELFFIPAWTFGFYFLSVILEEQWNPEIIATGERLYFWNGYSPTCDQIWRNLNTHWQIFEGLINWYLAKHLTYFGNLLCYWSQTFIIVYIWANIEPIIQPFGHTVHQFHLLFLWKSRF